MHRPSLSYRLSAAAVIVCLLSPSLAHAATIGYFTSDFGITLVNMDSNSGIGSIASSSTPKGVATNGTGVYIMNQGTNNVSVFDARIRTIVKTVSVGSSPITAATSGTGVYVINNGSDNVSIIDARTNTVAKTVSVGSSPNSGINNGTGVYITNQGTNNVSIIDARTNTVVKTVNVGSFPTGIGASGTGVYVTNQGADNVSIIDARTNTVVKTVNVGSSPIDAVASGTGVYVLNQGSDNVSIIDVRTNTVVRTVTLTSLLTLDIATTGTGVFVTHLLTNASIIDSTNNALEVGHTAPSGGAYYGGFGADSVTATPTYSIPSTAVGCSPTVQVQYTLPETPLAGSVQLQFYHVPSHSGATLTLGDTASGDFIVALHDVTTGSNVNAVTPNHWSASDGAYIVYLTYQDLLGNSAASVDLPLTVTTSGCSSSSSSSSSSGGGGGGGGGTRTYGSSSSVNIETRSFTGGASSSSSSSSSSGASHGAAPAENALCQSWDVSASFADVAANGWYECYVGSVVGLKIFEGYKLPDGTPKNLFGPGDNITLGQLAKVATILRNKEDLDPKPTGDEWYLPYIGAVQAYDAMVFNSAVDPLALATRQQVIFTIMEALQIPMETEDAPYSDVPESNVYFWWIGTATKLGFVSGDDGSDKFRPNEPINRAEVAKMLALALKHVGIVYEDDALPVSGSSSSSSSSSVAMVQTCTNKTPRAFPVRAQPTDSTAIVWHILAQQSARCEEANAGWWKLFGPNGEEGYVQKAMFVMSSAPSNQ